MNHRPLIENGAAEGRRITLFANKPVPEITVFKAPMDLFAPIGAFFIRSCADEEQKI
jgi:hypothetical protein